MKRSASLFGGALLAALLLAGCGGGGTGIVGGGGSGGGGIVSSGSFSATFTANSSNISTATFNPSVGTGAFSVVGNIRTLIATYVQVVGTSPRTIGVTLNKPSAFAVGDSFTVNASSDQTAAIGYVEGAGATTKAFAGTSGTVKITAIDGKKVSFTVTGVSMGVADGGGMPNTATGTFTLGGNGSVTAQSNLS